MPSLRLRLVNLIAWHIVRRHLRKTAGPEEARRDFDRFTRLLPVPRNVRLVTGKNVLRAIPHHADAERVILYFHGGAYLTGSPETHRSLCANLAAESGMTVIAPRYRRAPEHPAPAAFEDGLAAFDAIAAEVGGADRVILGGDSAGGGMALAVLAEALAKGPAPRGLFAFSPWTDLAGTGPSLVSNARVDRLLPAERMEEVVKYATGTHSERDPHVSPLYAEFRDPPPVLIQVARTEILYDDTIRIARRLEQAGGTVIVREVPDAPHVWQLLAPFLPEARQSIADVGAFVRSL